MVDQSQFNERCLEFLHRYRKAKKNLSVIDTLGPALTKPIEKIYKELSFAECRSGCSYCCFLRVVAFPYEVVAIYLFLSHTQSKERLESIKTRLQKQSELTKDLSLNEHFGINVKCPLLSEGKCLVYKVRPISCARHHSGSMEDCRYSYEHPEELEHNIPLSMDIMMHTDVQIKVATHVMNSLGDDIRQYELIRSLNMLFRKPSLVKKWKKGKVIFQ